VGRARARVARVSAVAQRTTGTRMCWPRSVGNVPGYGVNDTAGGVVLSPGLSDKPVIVCGHRTSNEWSTSPDPATGQVSLPSCTAQRTDSLTADAELVTVMVMSETMPLAQVKAHLSEVVDRVTQSHERVTITRHGRREAVVIAADDLDALEETLELLSDPAAVRDIAEGRAAAAHGEGLDAEAVRRRYLRGRG